MKSHCCSYDSGCYAPSADYNYEDVDCDCSCERCAESELYREPLAPEGAPPCGECGALENEPHAPGCPAEPATGLAESARRRSTSDQIIGSFDKFMDATLIKEAASRTVVAKDTPQRIYNKKYRETPANRTRVGGK